ncbi:8869_t:CDS:2 [Racocetra persica]|uniref:8869_t:CDS:1 n=1 Tax=Racocetra persica TaxID=160502 RepID=A0ACA9P013_9GLOM|nr:8869_t:CDS:2 [Racocetra persica]
MKVISSRNESEIPVASSAIVENTLCVRNSMPIEDLLNSEEE